MKRYPSILIIGYPRGDVDSSYGGITEIKKCLIKYKWLYPDILAMLQAIRAWVLASAPSLKYREFQNYNRGKSN